MEHHFKKYMRDGNLFLKKVTTEPGGPEDRDHAFRVLQAVFYTLRGG